MTTINEFYLKGYGYKRIAKELKISIQKYLKQVIGLWMDNHIDGHMLVKKI